MAFVVREVDLDRELPLFARIFNENFAIKGSDARFRWLYTDNPDGRATAWFVIDDRSGEVVGGTSVFPRRFRVAGSRTSVVAWNCGDFCIAPRFRSLGAAVKLRQAARDSIEAGASPFLYAHPNDRMLQIHLRVGHQPLGRMVRYARLLRPRTSSRIADAIGGAVLRVADPAVWRRSWQDAGVEPATSLNGDVTGLYEEIGPRLGTSLVRDAAYLRWRFFGSPEGRHELVATRAAGRLKGWLVFAMEGDVAVIRDWLALDTDSTDALFAAGVAEVRRRGARSVSVIALETHPDLPRLARFGFLRRPDSYTAVTYAASSWTQRSRVLDARHWYMTVGDRDI